MKSKKLIVGFTGGGDIYHILYKQYVPPFSLGPVYLCCILNIGSTVTNLTSVEYPKNNLAL
jgi:hypothetical protein